MGTQQPPAGVNGRSMEEGRTSTNEQQPEVAATQESASAPAGQVAAAPQEELIISTEPAAHAADENGASPDEIPTAGTSDEEAAPPPAEEQAEARELSPGEAFIGRLILLISTFSNRQSEVLRMSEHFDERDAELNDAKLRAKRLLTRELAEVDESVLDRYLRVFQSIDEATGTEAGEREAALTEALAEVSADLPEGIEHTYMSAVLRSLRPSLGARFLHSSLLTILVSELEMFINQLARACFEVHPGALGKERTLKWSEISAFDSIDEVRDHLVDESVVDLLHGSMLDWIEFFEGTFKISQITAARTFVASEAVQRRHCIAHNAGSASRQYVERLSAFKTDVKVGQSLDVDSAYIARAADALMLVAYSLVWALGVKLTPDKQCVPTLLSHLSNRTMFMLQEQRYDLVRQIVSDAPLASMSNVNAYSALVMQVNGWIAAKEVGRFADVRADVERFDVATRNNTFKLAKFALLDQNEEGLELAVRMLRDREIKLSHLLTWPLLRGIRQLYRTKEQNAAEGSSTTVEVTREEPIVSTPDL